MDLKSRLRRHGKDTRVVVAGLAALFVLLLLGFYLIQRGQDLPGFFIRNQVLLFALWYVNVVLILAILFVLIRNGFKLMVERRHRILGSKFKVKLVLTYFGLSLVPVLLLFAYATELLQGTVDRWINNPLTGVQTQGKPLVDALFERLETDGLNAARSAQKALAHLDAADPAARPELDRRLQGLMGELGVDYLAVFEGQQFVAGVVDAQSGLTDLPEPGRSHLAEALSGERSVWRVSPPGTPGQLLISVALAPPAKPATTSPTPPQRLILTGTLLPPDLLRAAEALIQAWQGHRQLVVQRDAIKASHVLLFALATLVILLVSSWVGLYLARRITVPIQALAEGTERVGRGELGHQVEVEADDELGVLVSSFNRMSSELETSRDQIEQSNRELKAANTRLAEERALIAAVVDNVAAGVVATSADGRIVTCNGAALGMLRQRGEDVLGRPAAEVWGDPERSKLLALLAVLDQEPDSGGSGRTLVRELHLVLGGDWKTFECKVTPMRGPLGERGRVLVLEDLTELIKAQQLAAWNEAARRIAHEIKNPLTPIQLAAERLLQKSRRQDPDLPAALESGVEIIVREVATMQAMVDEFSRYARMPRPQPAATDLGRLIAETLHLYRDLKPGVEVVSHVGDGEHAVRAVMIDAEQIRRALINLLDNAIEATEPPGTVRLSAELKDGRVSIHVADTGRGIPAPAKEKLFLPYFSTKGRGTGLGLAIVHRIVTDHHGTIRVEDNHPQGTIFTLELPAA